MLLGHTVIGLKQVRVSIGYEPSTHSLYEKSFIVPVVNGKPKISTFGIFTENNFLGIFRICALINVEDCTIRKNNS